MQKLHLLLFRYGYRQFNNCETETLVERNKTFHILEIQVCLEAIWRLWWPVYPASHQVIAGDGHQLSCHPAIVNRWRQWMDGILNTTEKENQNSSLGFKYNLCILFVSWNKMLSKMWH